MSASVAVGWRPRAVPLAPEAVVGRGEASRALARRVLADPGPWRGLVGEALLVVFADGDALPWAEGVAYLGRDPRAPSLWVDTRWELDVPPDLAARAVARRAPGAVAWLRAPDALVPLGEVDRLDPGALAAWVRP